MKEKPLYERKALRDYAQRLYKVFDRIYREGNRKIPCPSCGKGTLSIHYTRNENDNYGIWIECPVCHIFEHADVKGQPVGFKDDLVHLEYQQFDDRAWQSGQYRKECHDGGKVQILVADQPSEKTS